MNRFPLREENKNMKFTYTVWLEFNIIIKSYNNRTTTAIERIKIKISQYTVF